MPAQVLDANGEVAITTQRDGTKVIGVISSGMLSIIQTAL